MDLEKKGFQKGLILFGIISGVLVLLGTIVSFFVIDIVEDENDVDVADGGATIQFIASEDTNVNLGEGETYEFDVIFNYPGSTSINAIQYDIVFQGGEIISATPENLDFSFGFCSPVDGLGSNQLPSIYFENQLCLVGASNTTFANNIVVARVTVQYPQPGVFAILTGEDNNLYDSQNEILIPTVSGVQIGQVTVAAAPFCGDGNIDTGEVCDDGNSNGQVCTPGYGETCSYCNADCSAEVQVPVQTFCGDSIVNGNEECDDGNTNNLDSCSNLCVLAVCGDGITNGTEQCDDGNTVDTDSCSNSCTINEEQVEPVCGNGVVEEGEACDSPSDQTCNPTTCQINPVNTITCYSCTISETDGNSCLETQVSTFDGSTPQCPNGSSENSNCAQAAGGACPATQNPGDNTVVCGPIDVNDDKEITLTDFVSFVQFFGRSCSDTQVPANATTCGSKDQRDPIGTIGLSDLVYFASKFNRGANSCLAQ